MNDDVLLMCECLVCCNTYPEKDFPMKCLCANGQSVCESCIDRLQSPNCPYCRKKYEKIKIALTPFHCGICNLQFKESDALIKHVKKHRTTFKCTLCALAFTKKNFLIAHIKTHAPFYCPHPHCDKKVFFETQNKLECHRLKHEQKI